MKAFDNTHTHTHKCNVCRWLHPALVNSLIHFGLPGCSWSPCAHTKLNRQAHLHSYYKYTKWNKKESWCWRRIISAKVRDWALVFPWCKEMPVYPFSISQFLLSNKTICFVILMFESTHQQRRSCEQGAEASKSQWSEKRHATSAQQTVFFGGGGLSPVSKQVFIFMWFSLDSAKVVPVISFVGTK